MEMDALGSHADMSQEASLIARNDMKLGIKAENYYHVECIGEDGALKWVEDFENIVVTVGLNALLTALLKTIPGAVTWYVGLKLTGSVVLADTSASHGGWAESSAYSQANRPTWTPGSVAAGSVDNTGSVAVFSINGTATITGAFLIDNNTKGGTTGQLYGAGDFASSRSVISGDTLNCTITCTVA